MAPWMRALLRVVLTVGGFDAAFVVADLVTEGHFPSGRAILIVSIVFVAVVAVAVIPSYRKMPRKRPWIHYQFTIAQVALPMFAAPWIGLGIIALMAWHDGIPVLPTDVRNTAIDAVFFPVASLAVRARSVTLTPAGLIVRGRGVRVIDWSDVRNVAVERQFGVRTVVIRDAHQRRTRLNAPSSLLDRDFDAKVEVIRACWLGQYDWGRYPSVVLAR